MLLGHNGAGKTTIINMLTRQIKASGGSATAFGNDLLTLDYSKDLLSFCPQEDMLFNKLSVYENLEFFCRYKNVQDYEKKIRNLLSKFKMTFVQDQTPDRLESG